MGTILKKLATPMTTRHCEVFFRCKFKVEGYQRNPEKGEEEERKAEKRRKESGRMPPRGDKRREDFEKWYAANVR